MNRLLQIGFESVGHWKLSNGEPVFDLTRMMSESNILYAFVSDGEIKYVGKTTQPLAKRLLGYQSPGPTQSTNIKNRAKIKNLLIEGKVVDILALRDNGLLHYGNFHINLAAGLEDSLINKVRPEWNGRSGIESPLSDYPVSDNADDVQTSATSHTSTKTMLECDAAVVTNSVPQSFVLTVHKAYFNSGFFNVPIAYDRYFGEDLAQIEIHCRNNEEPLVGYINRTANQNNTPRIMGATDLKRWFRENFRLNGQVKVDILSPNSIRLKAISQAK